MNRLHDEIQSTAAFVFEKLKIILYNGKDMNYNHYINFYINYYQFRKNKELSPRTTKVCNWCYGKYHSDNKLYIVAKKYHDIKDYDKQEKVICNDCMYIICQLKKFNCNCIYLYKQPIVHYSIYPYKKWIVCTSSFNGSCLLAYDVGYISNYILSDNITFNTSYGDKWRIQKNIKEYMIKFNDYNILLKIYMLLKQVLLKDVSMYIGSMIISLCIKND